jgi:hypothetical protein
MFSLSTKSLIYEYEHQKSLAKQEIEMFDGIWSFL